MIEIGIPNPACVDGEVGERARTWRVIDEADPDDLKTYRERVEEREAGLGVAPECRCRPAGGDPSLCAFCHYLSRKLETDDADAMALKYPCRCPCHGAGELPLRPGELDLGLPSSACVDGDPAVRDLLKLAIRVAEPEHLAELEAQVLARKRALGLAPACTCARPGRDPEVCARDHLLTHGLTSLGAAIAAKKEPCRCACHGARRGTA